MLSDENCYVLLTPLACPARGGRANACEFWSGRLALGPHPDFVQPARNRDGNQRRLVLLRREHDGVSRRVCASCFESRRSFGRDARPRQLYRGGEGARFRVRHGPHRSLLSAVGGIFAILCHPTPPVSATGSTPCIYPHQPAHFPPPVSTSGSPSVYHPGYRSPFCSCRPVRRWGEWIDSSPLESIQSAALKNGDTPVNRRCGVQQPQSG